MEEEEGADMADEKRDNCSDDNGGTEEATVAAERR